MDKRNLFISNFKDKHILILKLLMLFGLVAFFLLHISPQFEGTYGASLIDKVSRSESINEPKIVLLGNSNLAFGIESEKIEKVLKMPVVNMGFSGDIGNIFHERMALINVNEGDIYIICHTSYEDDGTLHNEEITWITIENHWNLWKLLRFEDIKPMLEAYPVYLKKCISLWMTKSGNMDPGGVYSRSAFNQYGDIEWEDNNTSYDFGEIQARVPGISDNVVKRINDLNEYLSSKGAILLLAAYPIPDTSNRSSNEEFLIFEEELRKKMDPAVISSYVDYIYPCDYFFNSEHHLNNVGKEIRTDQLIEDLKKYFKEQEI